MQSLNGAISAGASAAFVIGAVSLAAANPLGTGSGSVRLKGDVALACSVTVTDLGQSLNLVGGETGKAVGSIVETCNAGTGYLVTINSANAGYLRNDAAGAIAYSVTYDGQGGTLGNALPISRTGAQFGRQSALAVTVPAGNQATAGTYSDTLTVTITAK